MPGLETHLGKDPVAEKPAGEVKIPDGLVEVGPRVTFSIRRTLSAPEDTYKESFKRPRVLLQVKKKVSRPFLSSNRKKT